MEIGIGGGDRGRSRPGAATEEVREKATELTRTARHRAMSALDVRKAEAASLLDKVAESVQDDRLGGYVADYARRGARFVRERSAEDLLSSARTQLRSRPGLLLSACFVGGLAIARLLRAGNEGADDSWRGHDDRSWRGPEELEPASMRRERELWAGRTGWERGGP